jgi:hypothetical protein
MGGPTIIFICNQIKTQQRLRKMFWISVVISISMDGLETAAIRIRCINFGEDAKKGRWLLVDW